MHAVVDAERTLTDLDFARLTKLLSEQLPSPAAGFISVLSPVGSSLLGLKVRDIAKWLTPNGEQCAAEIVAIHYQPEESGDYTR